jgi:hypothetical protein
MTTPGQPVRHALNGGLAAAPFQVDRNGVSNGNYRRNGDGNGNGTPPRYFQLNGPQLPLTPTEPPSTPEPSPPRTASQQRPENDADSDIARPTTPSLAARATTMPARAEDLIHDDTERDVIEDNERQRKKGAAKPKVRNEEEDERAQHYPRISRPVELMRQAYDCVVIGSGYGGSIAASRMARAGKSVCLLELGKEKWPGEYPVAMTEAVQELHTSGELSVGWLGQQIETGSPTGMFHLMFGKGQNAIVCNGLGGTSLMNANVFLEADKHTMAMKAWPPQLRQQGVLDPCKRPLTV